MSRFIYYYAECPYAECPYAECHYAKCHYAECHNALSVVMQYYCAECRGPLNVFSGFTKNCLRKTYGNCKGYISRANFFAD